MDKKKLMLLLGALVIAIGTAMAARSLFSGAGSPQVEAAQVPQGPKVLVAQRALPARSSLPIPFPSSSGRRKWSRTPTSSKVRPT
jgi:hypothetical protein